MQGLPEGSAGPRVATASPDLGQGLFQAIFENAAVGICQVAPDGSFLRANARLCEILGHAEAELLGLRFQDLTHPDDLATDMVLVGQLARGEVDRYSAEKRYLRRDGGIVWAHLSVGCVRGADGAVAYFVSVVEDITTRKETEAALRASEERLRLAFQAGQLASWDWDIASGRVEWSENLAEIIGLGPAGFGGTLEDFRALVHPEDRERVGSALAAALAGQAPYAVEFRMVRPDGSIRWAAAQGTVLRDDSGKPVRMVGFDVDVTARKQAEMALADVAERYRLALLATRDTVWDRDLVGGTILWNGGLRDRFGHDPAAATSFDWWAAQVHPDDRPRVLDGVRAVLEGGGDHGALEYRFRRADGSYAVVLDRAFIRRDGQGRAVRLVGAIQDMTERRRAEETRQLLLRELDHRVQNLFSMATAMVSLTARHAETPDDMAVALTGRLMALAKAHELVRPAMRPGTAATAGATGLCQLADTLLAPHLAGAAGRLVTDGPEVVVGAPAVTGLSLVLHELATNAAKYGALSVPAGKVLLSWETTPDRLLLRWSEQGGPALAGPPRREGFGSRLIAATAQGQLSGSVAFDWAPDGLRVTLDLPLDGLGP